MNCGYKSHIRKKQNWLLAFSDYYHYICIILTTSLKQ